MIYSYQFGTVIVQIGSHYENDHEVFSLKVFATDSRRALESCYLEAEDMQKIAGFIKTSCPERIAASK